MKKTTMSKKNVSNINREELNKNNVTQISANTEHETHHKAVKMNVQETIECERSCIANTNRSQTINESTVLHKDLNSNLDLILSTFMNQIKSFMTDQLDEVKRAIQVNSHRIDSLFNTLENKNG